MIKAKLLTSAIYLLVVLGIIVHAMQDGFVELNAEGKLEIVGKPEIGKEFEMVFTFTPLAELSHSKGIPDTVKILPRQGLTCIDGDSLWAGFLESGKTYSIRATYRVDTALVFQAAGRITAQQVFGPGTPYGTKDGVRATRIVAGKSVNVGFDTSRKVILKRYDINKNDSSIIEVGVDTVSLDLFPPIESKPWPDSGETKKHK